MRYLHHMPKPEQSAEAALLSTADIAKRWGVHVRTVHRLVQRGELVPALQGPGATGAFLFRVKDVDGIVRLTTTRAA